jgi:hypothetical protein
MLNKGKYERLSQLKHRNSCATIQRSSLAACCSGGLVDHLC